MTIRSKAVEEAKRNGICSQCLKHKAKEHMWQCERCINTNRRKRERMNQMTKSTNMCVQCNKHPREEGKKRCPSCLAKGRAQWYKRKARVKARLEALGSKDEGEPREVRKYTRRVDINPIKLQSMVNELELFITKLPSMTAKEYLEEREMLIKSIIIKGRE